jgi:two-component system OmpR family sensor kinase
MTRLSLKRLRPTPLRDWTLRARLVASLVGLLVVICVFVGAFTEIALNHFLMGRLDDQLRAAGNRVGYQADHPISDGTSAPTTPGTTTPGGTPVGTRFGLFAPGVEVNTIVVRVQSNGTTTAQILQQPPQNGRAGAVAISATAIKALEGVQSDGHPRTLNVPGYGAYRVSSVKNPDGTTQVTGLPLTAVNDTLVNLTAVITGVALIGLVLAALLGAFIVRLALRPLRRVTSTATKVAEMPLDEGEVALAVRVPGPNPHTEVGQVGVALNRMLENVSDALNARHQSETRVRQFVADASHELRTPLASIRGYAELTRRSREAAPPDIAHAMNRVESEANRMTTLVEDLLLLARLDEGRPLDADEVDLTRLTVDVVSDAHVAGRDHKWNLDLGEEPISVCGDSARLQQVLVNLLANARTHTPAGTNVWISLSQQGSSAILRVADDGPGIPAEQMPDIFERFSRGEQSRSRAAGSTGLGLAIVAAVIAAHGGRITAESEPGETVFTVTLPTQGNRPAGTQTQASLTGQIDTHDGRNTHRTGSLPTI